MSARPGSTLPRTVALLLAVVLAGALTSCSRSSATNGNGYVSGDGQITFVAPDERKAAPRVAGQGLDGASVGLQQFAGKTVVINVWGSWCAPCRREAPDLVKVSREYADRDVQFLGVNIRDQAAAARAFVRRTGTEYPSIYDPSSQTLLGFAGRLPSSAIPTTWIIDAEGRIAVRVLNEVSASTLSGLIDDVRAGREGASDG